jgi:hypothetical protein
VPLTHGWNYFLAPFLALALVGGLALVLKWTFNDVDLDDDDDLDTSRPTSDAPAVDDLPSGDLASPERAASPAGVSLPSDDLLGPGAVASPDAAGGSASAAAEEPSDPDDYGLLSVVTVADSADSAQTATTLLAEAGIRATVATGLDGRIRVLVFENDLYRARRVVGWPA